MEGWNLSRWFSNFKCVFFSSWSQTFPFWWMFSYSLISFLDTVSPPFLFFLSSLFPEDKGDKWLKTNESFFFNLQFTKGRHISVFKIPPTSFTCECYQLWQLYCNREISWTNVTFYAIHMERSPFPIFSLTMSLKLQPFSCQVGCMVIIWDTNLNSQSLESLQSAGAGGWSEKGWREGSVRASSKAGEIPHRVILFVWSYAGN